MISTEKQNINRRQTTAVTTDCDQLSLYSGEAVYVLSLKTRDPAAPGSRSNYGGRQNEFSGMLPSVEGEGPGSQYHS